MVPHRGLFTHNIIATMWRVCSCVCVCVGVQQERVHVLEDEGGAAVTPQAHRPGKPRWHIAAMPLRHVQRIAIRFYGFDNNSRFCRELLRRVNSPTMLASHPKIEIKCDVASTPVDPLVEITYLDQSQETFGVAPPYAPRTSAKEIVEAIEVKAKVLELHEAKPWSGMRLGRWGPSDGEHYPAAIRAAIDKGVASD
eukprot:m.124001 g.124001  ORF g.124001 m.124001 type:complete len:196 (+) comp11140_c1_seq1:1836-2423(+)